MPKQPPRELAQAASISGAIFAAIVGADPFDIRHRSHWVQVVDYVAILFWVIAVLFFVLVLAGDGHARDWPAWLTRRLPAGVTRVTTLGAAVGSAAAAGLLTIIALAALPFGVALDHDNVLIVLAPSQRQALDKLCGTRGQELRGNIPTSSLESAFVIFDFAAKTSRGCETVRIPSGAIRMIEEHPPPAAG